MTMARYDMTAVDTHGEVLAGAMVEVRSELPGTPLAALKSDRAGTTAENNPLTADANGKAGFYVTGGFYQITVTSGAFTLTRRYVAIGLLQGSDIIDLATQISGNLPVSRLNSGTDASAATFWRGDGTWAAANPIHRPASGPVAAPWPNALGDSLFTNAHVTTALPTLIRTALGWSSINTQAVSGATIADQASIYGFQMTPSLVNPALVWLGTNDVILDSSDNRTTEQTSLEGLRAMLFHLAIPAAKRVTGQAMMVSAGTWSNMGSSLDPGGTSSATNSSVKRAVVTGKHIVVAGWANLLSNGQAIVSFGNDVNSVALFNDTLTFKRPAILTNSPGGTPTTTIPFVRVYKNVGVNDNSKTTISVAVTSATGAGNDVFISYVAGLSGKHDEVMPLVLCSKLHNFTSAGESAQGTNAARRERFNRGIVNIMDEALGLGLWLVPVDAPSVLWNTSLLDTDGVHPINAGNAALTTEWVAAINGAQAYHHIRNSILNAAGSDTNGSDLLARGSHVIEDFRIVWKPRGAVGSGFSAHKNSVNQSIPNNTPTLVTFSTERYDVRGDFASDAWTPGAGQVALRAGVTFTAGVDQADYQLYIFKNGSSMQLLEETRASGTGAFHLGGVAYDLATDMDVYTVVVLQISGGSATIDGMTTKTYFSGMSAY